MKWIIEKIDNTKINLLKSNFSKSEIPYTRIGKYNLMLVNTNNLNVRIFHSICKQFKIKPEKFMR